MEAVIDAIYEEAVDPARWRTVLRELVSLANGAP